MSKQIVTVEMDDMLHVVKDIFDSTCFHHLLVVESGRLYGVLSDRDLLKSMHPNVGTMAETTKNAASLNKKVHQVMTRKLITLEATASVYEAIDIFNNYGLSCIPVVDAQQKPIGIISWRDIMKVIKLPPSVEAS
ncbi:MAG: CBS domain-containing protein [Candidatus Polarisedimenticolaceae bacterium]|nr:CBS domain-containing protein [Candidatus Polarisedimenticolaceae bacterium]